MASWWSLTWPVGSTRCDDLLFTLYDLSVTTLLSSIRSPKLSTKIYL